MSLSVVILTCNQAAVTRRCLDSLAASVRDVDGMRVVLVDNGSTDNTMSLVESSDVARRGILSVISLPQNIGVAPGRNVGLQVSRDADYVLILDNDTIVPPGTIKAMIQYLDSNPGTGLVGPRLVSPDGRVQRSFKDFPGILEKARNLAGRSPYANDVSAAPAEPFYVIGACQMIRGEAMRRVGLLDDNIFFGPEDADYCMRVRSAGYKVEYLPHITITHDWQRKSASSPLSSTSRRHIRGLVYFYRKWHRWL